MIPNRYEDVVTSLRSLESRERKSIELVLYDQESFYGLRVT